MDDEGLADDSLPQADYLAAEAHRLSNIVQIMAALLADRRRHLEVGLAREQIEWAEQNLQSLMLMATSGNDRFDGDFNEQFGLHMEHWRAVFAARSIELDVSADRVPVPPGLQPTLVLIATELLTNASKHAFRDREGGRIRVSLRRIDDRRGELLVADDGPGLPPGASGAGLGLDLLDRLARRMGGTLRFESDGGLTATLRFPIIQP